jgi:hypothetical protein
MRPFISRRPPQVCRRRFLPIGWWLTPVKCPVLIAAEQIKYCPLCVTRPLEIAYRRRVNVDAADAASFRSTRRHAVWRD